MGSPLSTEVTQKAPITLSGGITPLAPTEALVVPSRSAFLRPRRAISGLTMKPSELRKSGLREK